MKNKRLLKMTAGAAFFFLFLACASRERVVYYQKAANLTESEGTTFETVLQPDDALMLVVMGENPEVAMPFNMPAVQLQATNETGTQQQRMNSYLIDAKGLIQFPIVGAIKLGGLTRAQAIAKMNQELSKYIANPTVNLRILNFKVTVQGEVQRPGVHSVASERITLPEALSLSGDLSIYGRRDNVMVIREKDGKKEIGRVDITKADFINSPYYYLAQNDVVYVEPNKTKVNASAVGPNTGIIISAISLLLTVVALIIR